MSIGEFPSESAVNTPSGNSTDTGPVGVAMTEDPAVKFSDHFAVYIAPHVSENRELCISEAAYFRAEHRGFAPGHEFDDWLAAESEVDHRFAGEGRAY